MTTPTSVYSDEQVNHVIDEYKKGKTYEERESIIKNLAEELGRTVNSVRAKLAYEKVYIPKVYTTKTGAKVETKAQMVTRLEEKFDVQPGELESLEKATKSALRILLGE